MFATTSSRSEAYSQGLRPARLRSSTLLGTALASASADTGGLPSQKPAGRHPRRCGKCCYDHASFAVGIERPGSVTLSAPRPILVVRWGVYDHHRPERIVTGMGSMSLLIALTGATGFIGQYLLQELPRRGHRLRVLLRRPTNMPVQGSSAVIGDLSRPQNMGAALAGVDAIVHSAGIAGATSGCPEDDYRILNTEATIGLAQAAHRAGVKRFVFLSSIRAQCGPHGRAGADGGHSRRGRRMRMGNRSWPLRWDWQGSMSIGSRCGWF